MMVDSHTNEPDIDHLIDLVRLRAAVIGVFDPFELIASSLDDDSEARVLDALAADADEVLFDGEMLWKMNASARQDELLKARQNKTLLTSVLKGAKPHPKDTFGRFLLRLLRRQPPPNLSALKRFELQDLAVAQDFAILALGGRPAVGLADPRLILARRDDQSRLAHVAPKLIGRKKQLAALQTYATTERLSTTNFVVLPRKQAGPQKLKWLRPVLLTGVGGSGKSALVAETVRSIRRDDWSGPITVLLDFDRPNLALGTEKDWTAELTRQVGRARPQLDAEMDALRRRAVGATSDSDSEIKTSDALVQGLARVLSHKKERHDLVIVIDTFEEMIVQSDMTLEDDELETEPFGLVLSWVDRIKWLSNGKRTAFRSVRSIVAGRAKPFGESDVSRVADWFCAQLSLDAFEDDETVAFLKERGDPNLFTEERSRKIAAIPNIPWLPLLLLILIRFAEDRSPEEVDEILRNDNDEGLLQTSTAIAVLYSRFLDRVRDHIVTPRGSHHPRTVSKETIKRLAHPGLALRSVTPELIREVLAEPCGLGEVSEHDAVDLLTALSKEAWLVERAGPNEVRHTPNLRRLMLPMLCGDKTTNESQPQTELRARVKDVQRRAAAYYSARDREPTARTLSAYYQAFLGDIEQLVADERMRREVSQLAGEDVLAMPVAARSMLLKDSRSLSRDELATLPEDQKRRATSLQRSRKAKAGIVRASRSGGPKSALAGSDVEAAAIQRDFSDIDQIINDRYLDAQVSLSFASANFIETARLARPATLALGEALRRGAIPPLIAEITSHWLWKWALACLASGEGGEITTWQLDGPSRLNNYFDFRTYLAVAMVATGNRSLGLRTSRGFGPPIASLSLPEMRLFALGLLPRPSERIELPVSQIPIFTNAVWDAANGRRSAVHVPKQLVTDLKVLSSIKRAGAQRYVAIGEIINSRFKVRSEFLLRRTDMMQSFVRGKTPELHHPVRAALIDVGRYNPTVLQHALEVLSTKAPFWPDEFLPRRLMAQMQKTRQADYLLTRLMDFLDACDLLRDLLGQIRRSRLERSREVGKLYERYDRLLLGGRVRSIWS